jgi:hypothetical protein
LVAIDVDVLVDVDSDVDVEVELFITGVVDVVSDDGSVVGKDANSPKQVQTKTQIVYQNK